MKKILIFATLAISLNAVAQNTTSNLRSLNPKIDSTYYWTWDTISLGWKLYQKKINIGYDAKNNVTSELYQIWKDTVWENSDHGTYGYDVNNNKISELTKTWNGSAWKNSNQSNYTFDVKNNMTSELHQLWDSTSWLTHAQFTYTYDANNNRTSEIHPNCFGTCSNYRQSSYTYDANNNQLRETMQAWNVSAWENYIQYTNIYDSKNNRISALMEVETNGAWDSLFLDTYTYDTNNNQTSKIGKNWNSGSGWVNSSQNIYTYNANNNQIKILFQNWSNSAWVDNQENTYTYDANNNQTSQLSKTLNGGNPNVNQYQSIGTYDTNNFKTGISNKYWNTAGNKIRSGDSTHMYFHSSFICPSSARYTTVYDTVQNTFTLTLDSPSSATYHWDFGDGSTSTLATPTHLYTVDTVYNVCLRVSASSSDTCTYCHVIGKDAQGNIYRTAGFTLNVVNSNVTDIPAISSNENTIGIYPNPTSGKFNLIMSQFENLKIKDIGIYNMMGENVYSQTLKGANTTIDLSEQPNGIYFICIITNEGIVNKKIVINQ